MKLKFIFILCFTCCIAFAQNSISGKILENNIPLNDLEIIIYDISNRPLQYNISNEDGFFEFTVENGSYILEGRLSDKILFIKETFVNDNNIDLGTIEVEMSQTLNEIIIVGKKRLIERKVDRLIFNFENTISASGGDAFDALKITPGLRINNDAINMIGKNGISVMVDDRIIQLTGDDLINFLKTISSDNIKNIEVITAPPAKYSAEGNSGLINIRLKKMKKDSWSINTRASYNQANYSTGNIGSNFSYQKNKLSVLLDISEKNGGSNYLNDIEYYYPTQNWKSEILNKTNQNSISSLIGLTYDLTSKSQLSVQYLGGFNKYKVDENNYSNVYNYQSNFLDFNLNSEGRTNREIDNNSVNFNFTTKIDTIGKFFSINVDYFEYVSNKLNNFNSKNNNYITSTTTNHFNDSANNQSISNFSADIDFNMPYEWATINYGTKVSSTKTNSNLKNSIYDIENAGIILNSSQVNIFEYRENNQALYFSANKQLGEKWEFKVGLRSEFIQTSAFAETINSSNKNSYYKIFPTIYAFYKINDNNTVDANYSRRINRPAYSNLNPARWYFNSNSYEEGNPFLQPSYSHNAEFSHMFKDILVSTISLSKIENGFGQLTIHDEVNNIQKSIRENYFDSKFVGIDETLTSEFFRWWTSINNLGTYYTETNTKTYYLQPKFSGWGGYFSTTNSFILNKIKTITGELTFDYNFPAISGESKISSYSNTTIAIKYILLNKKLVMTFLADDIFKTNIYTISNTTQDVNQSFRQYYDTQSFRISLSYKFGSDKVNIQKRDFGNQEEKNRT